MVVTEKKYQLGTAENQEFLQDVRDGLLSFGHQFPSPGGSSYYLGDDGTPWKERNRETWITSRMAHVYSIGSMLGHEGSEALADAALKGLRGELHDDQNGGWYAGLTKDNEIVPTKQCYAHAFVILAASSGVLAGRKGAEELLKDALALYDLRFWNEKEGLSCDTWNTEFTELDSYRGLNAKMLRYTPVIVLCPYQNTVDDPACTYAIFLIPGHISCGKTDHTVGAFYI